jgi:hypothetical protein
MDKKLLVAHWENEYDFYHYLYTEENLALGKIVSCTIWYRNC